MKFTPGNGGFYISSFMRVTRHQLNVVNCSWNIHGTCRIRSISFAHEKPHTMTNYESYLLCSNMHATTMYFMNYTYNGGTRRNEGNRRSEGRSGRFGGRRFGGRRCGGRRSGGRRFGV